MTLAELDIASVWSALGGGPLRGKRGQAFWRNGDGYSVAVAEKGAWRDYRDSTGGRVLALVETALGCDRRTALGWLENNCGLDSRRPLSASERRTWARHRAHAEEAVERVQWWHDGLLCDLEKTKLAAYQKYMTHPAEQTEMAWSYACARLYVAEQLHGGELLGAYRHAREQNSKKVERLIEAAHEDQEGAEFHTAFIVALLGVSALNKGQVV